MVSNQPHVTENTEATRKPTGPGPQLRSDKDLEQKEAVLPEERPGCGEKSRCIAKVVTLCNKTPQSKTFLGCEAPIELRKK